MIWLKQNTSLLLLFVNNVKQMRGVGGGLDRAWKEDTVDDKIIRIVLSVKLNGLA